MPSLSLCLTGKGISFHCLDPERISGGDCEGEREEEEEEENMEVPEPNIVALEGLAEKERSWA